MSYVLHIMPMPAHIDTLEGVYAEWERLNQLPRHTEPNSTFGEVGYYLRLRYPVDPNNPEFSPWLEGPPHGDTLEHVWALGFNTSAPQASSAFSELVSIANTLDLAVVDDQTASAWLPGGRELLGPQLQQQQLEVIDELGEPEDMRPHGRVLYTRVHVLKLQEKVNKELEGLVAAHGYKYDGDVNHKRQWHGLEQTVAIWMADEHSFYGGGLRIIGRISSPLPESIRQVVDACFPKSYGGEPTTEEAKKIAVNMGIRIDINNYLSVVDRDFFRNEDPDYQHIPQDQIDPLKRPTQFRNFTGSAADAPACISYGEWLMFANQADLRDKVMARARKYLTEVVLPSMDGVGDSKMMAEYYLQHGVYNAFYDPFRVRNLSLHWLSAVGLHYPGKLKQECDKVLDYIKTTYLEDILRSQIMGRWNQRDMDLIYQFMVEFSEKLFKHFGVK